MKKILVVGILIIQANLFSQDKLYAENFALAKEENHESSVVESKLIKADLSWMTEAKSTSLFKEKTYLSKTKTVTSEDKVLKRLESIDSKTDMDLAYNPVILGYVERYLKMGNHMEKTLGLAEFFFPLFEDILAEHNVPEEIKYLAVVESNLKTKATSRVGAQGLWQFMPATAREMALEINAYVDERNDPVKATTAAAKYLKYLYGELGDWNLALAAYNCGLGNVKKAIRRSGGKTDYWSLRPFLPGETRGYVPTFVAANYIISFSEEEEIKTHPLKFNYSDTDIVWVNERVSFNDLSKQLNLTKEELEFLNPQYIVGIIPKIKGKKYSLRLPKNRIDFFVQNQKEINKGGNKTTSDISKAIEYTQEKESAYYTVKAGDTLSKISSKYKVNVQRLQALNNIQGSGIIVGQKIRYK